MIRWLSFIFIVPLIGCGGQPPPPPTAPAPALPNQAPLAQPFKEEQNTNAALAIREHEARTREATSIPSAESHPKDSASPDLAQQPSEKKQTAPQTDHGQSKSKTTSIPSPEARSKGKTDEKIDTLSRAEVFEIMRDNAGELRACYMKGDDRRAPIHIRIAADGTVPFSIAKKPKGGKITRTTKCVAKGLRSFRFPSFDGVAFEIDLPFHF